MTSISIKKACSKCIQMKSDEDFNNYMNEVGCIFKVPWSYDLYLHTGHIIENVVSTSCNGPSAESIDELEIEFECDKPRDEERKIYVVNAVDIVGYSMQRHIKEE